MRALWQSIAVAVLIGGLGACASPQDVSLSGNAHGCDAVASRPLAFSSRRAIDTLEARASGSTSCARLRSLSPFACPMAGRRWRSACRWRSCRRAWAAPNQPRRPSLTTLLRRYVDEAQLDARPGALPVWKKGEPTPGFDLGMELTSPLSRQRYAALRSARPNLLCLRDAQESFSCHVWDRKRRRAEVILQH
jgi:hypothetical protein